MKRALILLAGCWTSSPPAPSEPAPPAPVVAKSTPIDPAPAQVATPAPPKLACPRGGVVAGIRAIQSTGQHILITVSAGAMNGVDPTWTAEFNGIKGRILQVDADATTIDLPPLGAASGSFVQYAQLCAP